MNRLRNETMGPDNENAGDLSLKSEQAILDWAPGTLYKKRLQLAGGPGGTGNGFAVWRRLLRDNKDSGDVVEHAGIEVLHDDPRCSELPDQYILMVGQGCWTTMALSSHKLHAHLDP